MLEPVLTNPWVRAVGALLALVLLGVVVYILKPILVPLFLALIVAYVFDPVVDYFEARKISRGVTIAGLAVIGILGALSVPLVVLPSVYHQAEGLIRSANTEVVGGAWLERMLERLPFDKMAAELEPSQAETAPETTTESAPSDTASPATDLTRREVLAMYIGQVVRKSALQFVKGNLGTFAAVGKQAGVNLFGLFALLGNGVLHIVLFVANFALFAFVAGYLLRDFDGLVRGARELIPPKHRDKTVSIASQINDQLRSFLRGQITVCFCLGAMYLIGFLLARTPFAILIAAFGVVASFIPYLGVTMVAITAATLTILQYGFDWHILVVIATIAIAQALEGNVLTPKIVGDKVGLNPVWVILAILVFGNFLGFLGLLLAVPIAAALKVLVIEGIAYYRKTALFADGQAGGG